MGIRIEMGMVLGPKEVHYIETEGGRQLREIFEMSHDFKVGDVVYLSASWLASNKRLYYSYADLRWTIQRIKTEPATGACIRIWGGGVGLNIWHPDKDLIRANQVTELLYEE